jgi:CheY-like chemotaxis protein
MPKRDLRVLIAEPGEATAAIAADYLVAAGVETERASSAEDALGRGHFDVAIVGIDPPERAAELAAKLRANGAATLRLKDVGAPTVGEFDAELTRPLKRERLYRAVLGGVRGDGGDEAPPAPAPVLTGMRVLVADDDDVNRALLVRQLAKLGVQAESVTSGQEVLAAVHAGRYDAVLMDAHMPSVDGLEAARAIRALPGERGSTPIVAVTAGGTPEERDACLAAGMDGFVLKPLTSSDLARALGDVLAPRPSVDAGALVRLEEDLGGQDELRRIAGIYLSQLGPLAATIVAAANAEQHDALRRAAHRLGAASATFGAIQVAELCRRLEDLGESGQPARAGELARSLEAACRRADVELRALLA